jgi:4-hydroxybenzoate polyprenyltransferase
MDSRTGHIIFWELFAVTGLVVANAGVPPLFVTFKVLGLVAAMVVSVYVLNDAMDSDMDKYNVIKSNRPIPSGQATKNQALQISLVGGVIAVSIALTMNLQVLLLALIYMTLGFLYSVPPFSFKKRVLGKESIPVAGFLLVVGISSLASGSFNVMPFFNLAVYWVIFIFTLVPTFYEATDMKEDKMYGVKSIAILIGQKRRLEMAIVGTIVMIATSPFSYLYFGYNVIFPLIVSIACLLFLRYAFPLLINNIEMDEEQVLRGVKMIRLFLIVLLFSFMVGSLNIF